MPPERSLTAEEEEQWQELSHHIDWAERFSLILLFAEDAKLAEAFKQRLQSQLQGRVSTLKIIKPNHPETLTQDIFSNLQQGAIPYAIVPCWLELHRHRSPEWLKALDNFFARFNERRDLIRHQHPHPLIILLPLVYKARLRNIAPDLWSIRGFTDELRPALIKPEPKPPTVESETVFNLRPTVRSEQELAIEIREWQRVKDLPIADEELFLVTQNAFQAALDTGQWSFAQTLVDELLRLSNALRDDENSTSLCRLNLALDASGRLSEKLGQYEQALGDFSQCLKIDHALQQHLGDRPEFLRDMSVSLNKVADMENRLGRYESALAGYQESLVLARELQNRLGDSPQVLRDLSIYLEKVADMDDRLGRYESALVSYKESLVLARELKKRLGDTPEVLRDLSVSLEKVADMENRLGRYESALAGYQESLALCRELKKRLGETPQVLRDLCVSLEKVSDMENQLGRYESALAGYQESLALCRELTNRLGDTPHVLRDMSISLERVADMEARLGRYESALADYLESLALRSELKKRLGDTPEVLQDLSFSLQKLAACEAILEQPEQALAHYRECLQLLERLQAAQSFNQYSTRINNIKAKIAALEQGALES